MIDMAHLGQTTVVEILGPYAALLDEKHNLELEALALMNSGVSHWSAQALANGQARCDVNRKLAIYQQLSVEAALLIGVPT